MKEYSFYQDQLVTIWQRHDFTIKAKSKKEALRIITAEDLASDYIGELADEKKIISGDTEYLYETIEEMSPEDNDGSATIIICDMNDNSICSNEPEPTLGKPERKELRVFTWHFSLLSLEPTNEEIVETWKNPAPVPDNNDDEREQLRVEMLTFDQFTKKFNNEEICFETTFIRFIEIPV